MKINNLFNLKKDKQITLRFNKELVEEVKRKYNLSAQNVVDLAYLSLVKTETKDGKEIDKTDLLGGF